jgi:hypothetical protein
MSSGRDNNLSFNDIRVHAGLGVVVQSNQSPVGNHTGNTTVLDDQILSSQGIEQRDVGTHEELGEDGGSEKGGVFDDDIVFVAVIEWNADLGQEVVAGLADNHGREELTTQPGTTAGGDTLLDDCDLDVWVLAQFPCAAQTLQVGRNK